MIIYRNKENELCAASSGKIYNYTTGEEYEDDDSGEYFKTRCTIFGFDVDNVKDPWEVVNACAEMVIGKEKYIGKSVDEIDNQ